MLKFSLDASLARVTLRPLVGNWQFTEDDQTWADFEAGRTDAYRKIRVGGKTFWVSATRVPMDNSAAALHLFRGGRDLRDTMFTYFNLYRVDPRSGDTLYNSTSLGGGMIHRLKPLLRAEGWL